MILAPSFYSSFLPNLAIHKDCYLVKYKFVPLPRIFILCNSIIFESHVIRIQMLTSINNYSLVYLLYFCNILNALTPDSRVLRLLCRANRVPMYDACVKF